MALKPSLYDEVTLDWIANDNFKHKMTVMTCITPECESCFCKVVQYLLIHSENFSQVIGGRGSRDRQNETQYSFKSGVEFSPWTYCESQAIVPDAVAGI